MAAMAANRVIGRGAEIPWRIKGEQKRFKQLTMGHHLIFGRKTHESIGRALPGRTTIVISRQPDYRAEGCQVAASLAQALELCPQDEEVFVGGGAQIYREALPLANTLHLTAIGQDYEGDIYFPEFSLDDFALCDSEAVDGPVPYEVRVYRRRPGR